MTIAAILFMSVSVFGVVGLTVWCYWRLLFRARKYASSDRPRAGSYGVSRRTATERGGSSTRRGLP